MEDLQLVFVSAVTSLKSLGMDLAEADGRPPSLFVSV